MANDLATFESLDLSGGVSGHEGERMGVTAFAFGGVQFTIGRSYCALNEEMARRLVAILEKRLEGEAGFRATDSDRNLWISNERKTPLTDFERRERDEINALKQRLDELERIQALIERARKLPVEGVREWASDTPCPDCGCEDWLCADEAKTKIAQLQRERDERLTVDDLRGAFVAGTRWRESKTTTGQTQPPISTDAILTACNGFLAEVPEYSETLSGRDI